MAQSEIPEILAHSDTLRFELSRCIPSAGVPSETGGFFRAMSGTPIMRTVDLDYVDVLVDNRGSGGRSPAWTRTDLALVQRFRPFADETKSLEIDFTVINAFNQKTGLRTFRSLYRQSSPL